MYCSQCHEGSVRKKSLSDTKEDEQLKDFVLSRYIVAQYCNASFPDPHSTSCRLHYRESLVFSLCKHNIFRQHFAYCSIDYTFKAWYVNSRHLLAIHMVNYQLHSLFLLFWAPLCLCRIKPFLPPFYPNVSLVPSPFHHPVLIFAYCEQSKTGQWEDQENWERGYTDVTHLRVGVRILCRHNFEHNWPFKASSIMPA